MAQNNLWNTIGPALNNLSGQVSNEGVMQAELTDEQMREIVGSSQSQIAHFDGGVLKVGDETAIFAVHDYDSFTIQYNAANVPTYSELHVVGSINGNGFYGLGGTQIRSNGCFSVAGEFGKNGCPDAKYLKVVFASEVGGVGCKVDVQMMLRRYGHPKIQIEDALRWIAERRLKGEQI